MHAGEPEAALTDPLLDDRSLIAGPAGLADV